ncbi:C40 family peptidase [Chitinolyticbacter albus]|uniref:C40 family peptidase n=1 Tax=Chitinolyticbacter albus TaxID=2961951 RepID=UPI00210AA5BD|nr:C40 family peptidase [Chitinolyticbacter albus]
MKLHRRHLALCAILGALAALPVPADEIAQPHAQNEPAGRLVDGSGEPVKGMEMPAADSQPTPDGERRAGWGNRTPTKSSTEPADDHAAAQGLLLQAMGLIGVKYKYGGSDPSSGLDCSGFVRYVFQSAMNVVLPHNALAMSRMGADVERESLRPGDLVFFNTLGRSFSHVGIYLGDDKFIHSPRSGKSVQVENIQIAYWKSRWNGARRVSGEGLNVAGLLASAGQPTEVAVIAAAPKASAKCRTEKRKVKGKTKTVEVCSGGSAKPKTKSASKKKRR